MECRIERQKTPRATRPDPNKNSPHLEWIRSLQCSVSGCLGRSEAAHVRMNTGGGVGKKPGPQWAISLCHAHHLEQHSIGHREFDAKYGLNSRALAEQLAALSPHLKG